MADRRAHDTTRRHGSGDGPRGTRPPATRRRHPGRRVIGLAAAVLAAAGLLSALPGTASAAPASGAVLAEVYGGGGNSGATLTTDFVELGNRGDAPAALAGWSVQYLPANPSATSQWQVTPLTGTVPPGARYLVGEGRGSGGTVDLPTPDASGTIQLAAAAGTVALVSATDPLTCRTAADCAADPRIADLTGYGTAVVREGTPAPAPSATTSVARPADLPDTDDNGADFTAGPPTPTNLAGQSGGGTGGGTGGPTQPGPSRIHDIQGSTRRSPLTGRAVTGVPGVVTAIRAFGSARGFWFQDPQPDADPATSEGLFAFSGSGTPAPAVGDSVLVSGTVTEFYPLSAGETVATTANQSTTELTHPVWTVLSSGNPLPAAEPLTPDTVPTDYAPDAAGGSIEDLPLRPAEFALDYYESREGMRLELDDARVVGRSDSFNELWLTSKPSQNPTARGGTLYASYADPNSGRLEVVSLIPFGQHPFPQATVGDALTGATAGPLDYSSFGGYELQATALGELTRGTTQPETTRGQKRRELSTATYNVENLSPADPQAKFDRLATGVSRNLASPDIVALEEIQDDDGPADDGVVTASVTLQRFTDAIVAAGGPRYQWREIDPVNDADGGQPGGNIRVAFLFDPARVSFVDRPGGTSTTAVQAVRAPGGAALSVSPGRVDPADAAWTDSRKPLAGEFRFLGRTVFVIANHFVSKGGDQPLFGRFQPPARPSEQQRGAQAATLRGFVDQLTSIAPRADVVVLGDLNDFPFSATVQTLTAGGALRAEVDTLPAPERYSYDFQGNSQDIDHALATPSARHPDYDVVHVNAEFPDQASDHDPQVLRTVPSWGNPLLDALEDLIDLVLTAPARPPAPTPAG